MQILKKRNTTEPFNHNKSDGITNYDSFIDDFYTPYRARETYKLFSNDPLENPTNHETTIVLDTSGENTDDFGNTYYSYLRTTFPFVTPYSGTLNVSLNATRDLIQKVFIDKGFRNGNIFITTGWGKTGRLWWSLNPDGEYDYDIHPYPTSLIINSPTNVYLNMWVSTRENLGTNYPEFDISDNKTFPTITLSILHSTKL